MNIRRLLPILLPILVLSCDRDELPNANTASNTVSLAPRVVSVTGEALPRVDSVRIIVTNSESNTQKPYYEKSVDWNKHSDTILGIPKNAPVSVAMAGIKVQSDGSRVVWWSGTSMTNFGGKQTLGVESFPVPVRIGDTSVPVILARSEDPLQNTDSLIRMAWYLASDSSILAQVNGDTLHAQGDSVVWEHAWNASGSSLDVVATFRDKAGNLTIDSLVVVRRQRVATPSFSVASGSSWIDLLTVRLECSTSQAKLEYSTDSANWLAYGDSVILGTTGPLWARATKSGVAPSAIAKSTYSIQAQAPSFSPVAGTYDTTRTVTLSSPTSKSTIHFTLDGSTPTSGSPVYLSALVVDSTTTIKAITVKEGLASSSVATANFSIVHLKAPTFEPKPGDYDTAQTVRLSSTSSGTTIHYTVDGSDPTASSPAYKDPIQLVRGATIKAVAMDSAKQSSSVSTGVYVIGSAATPQFDPIPGTYSAKQDVTLISGTSDATIYYTLDGSAPSTNSLLYQGPIPVSAMTTIRSIAVAEGMANSSVASATYAIGSTIAPTFLPLPGAYADSQTVTIASTTPEAVIYYTTDGSAPSLDSKRYLAPLGMGVGKTIRAIAVAGGASSVVASATYVIGTAVAPTFSLASGPYSSERKVFLASATPGATIRFTSDGTEPTLASTRFTDSITVAAGATLRAIAIAEGMANSPVASATYLIGSEGTPTFSPGAGSYSNERSVVIASSLPDVTIHYTMDGSEPGAGSAKYNGPIKVSTGLTLRAVAITSTSLSTSISSATYLIGAAEAPSFSLPGGIYPSAVKLWLSSPTAGSTIHFTTNGSDPDANSTKFVDSLEIAGGMTVKAIAVASGMSNSSVTSATYSVGSTEAPIFEPAPGAFEAAQTVRLSSGTKNADIYFTTDGSTPDSSSTKFVDPILVAAGKTIKAIAIAGGMSRSSVTSATYLIGTTEAPAFDPPGGSFDSAQSVRLSSLTDDAAIHYTTNGSEPTAASRRFTSPILVASGQTIRAIAIAPGMSASSIAQAEFLIGTAGTPTFSPTGGSFPIGQTVSLTSSLPNATIYFTTDGTVPSASSTKYTEPIGVPTGRTIKALAIAPGVANSSVSSATYIIGSASSPSFDPVAGAYPSTQTVTLSSGTGGAKIYYTINGARPDTNATLYTDQIIVPIGQTLRAIAIANGTENSPVSTATYLIGTTSAPTFNPPAGYYTGTRYVDLGSASSGANIYYTTDGTTPTTASTRFAGIPIQVAVNTTIKAFSVLSGMSSSRIDSAVYSITAESPVFSLPSGTYPEAKVLSLTSPTPGAIIYYTTDGSTPTSSSLKYQGDIAVASGQTIKAIAIANGTSNSLVSTAVYVIGTVSAPTFTPAGGSYTGIQYVTLSSATAGASIYYTNDGTTPTTGSTKFASPIAVSTNDTIRAIASAPGMTSSSITSAAYLITAAPPTFSPAGGTYGNTQQVTISSAMPGAILYYTTDGTTPDASKNRYGGVITVSAGQTIKAIAIASGASNSFVTSATYVIGAVSAPTFYPPAGSYTGTQYVNLSGTNPDAIVYYTTDGSIPTTASQKYAGSITVTAGQTIKAVATFAGMENSSISTVTYNITAVAPGFSPPSGTYSTPQTVTLSSGTSGAIFHYTVNGSAPTTNSTLYTGPIAVATGQTIQAITTATGNATSLVSSATYLIGSAATPTFSLGAGSYVGSQSVTLATTTAGASIYYTTNGTDPAILPANLYNNAAIPVSANTTIKAIATANGMANSGIASAAYAITAVAPAFAPAGGTYLTAQDVTISSPTPGATIYYTTNGTDPTIIPANRYTEAINLTVGKTIKAISTAPGTANSAISTAVYVIGAAATPTFSLGAGSYVGSQSVTLATTTAGATIHYTTNGTAPTAASPTYSGAITVSTTSTIRAIAIANGMANSTIASAAYSITAVAPAFAPAGGTYLTAQDVTISSPTPGATIYYTTNGTDPTAASTAYTDTITVSTGLTIKAITIASGTSNSAISTAVYVIGAAATPTFSLGAGSYVGSQSVTLATTTAGATIHYTTNGTAPTVASPTYSGAITVSTTSTIRAIAIANGMANSTIASAAYSITAVAPAFAPAGGTYLTAQDVTISSPTPGATIYYTTNGTDPTAASTAYTDTITVSTGLTIKAITIASGTSNSAISTAVYVIGAAATPTFSLEAGSYVGSQSVTLATTTAGATIHYTTNGSIPTAASPTYSGAITVSTSSDIRAIAVAAGMANSTIASAAYSITAVAPAFAPAGGTYLTAQDVTISSPTPGATIYYTTNGTDPTAASTAYTDAITVSTGLTIKAITIASGANNSAIDSAVYVIGAAATPTFSLEAGSYVGSQSVTLATTTAGASIYYTTNGTAPTAASPTYSGAITVSTSSTIRAIAIANGMANSAVDSAAYILAAVPPTISPAEGEYPSAVDVTISSPTPGDIIYYTTDGTDPTADSPSYSGAFAVSATTTIKAITVTAGMTNSAVATATYTIPVP